MLLLASTMLLPIASVLGVLSTILAVVAIVVWQKLAKAKQDIQAKEQKAIQLERSLEYVESELETAKATLASKMASFESQQQETAQALKQAREATDSALAASKAKGTFLATMSHEVRTPLNCIRGLSEVLLACEPTDEQQGHLNTICRSVDALLAIIGNVLDYSKIEAGKLDLSPERFSFNELLDEIQTLFEVQAASKGLYIKVELDDDSPLQVVTDRNHFRQVLINLVGNAIKFTETGGITIQAARERIQDESLPKNKTFYHVMVRVCDTGIGIPDAKKGELFVAFNQLVDSRTRKYEGTGLGLAICKRIVETGMKGEILVEDNKPQGTIFAIHIPLEGFTTAKRKEPDAKKLTRPGLIKHSIGQSFYSHNILVADDNRLNCQVMKAMLEKMGHKAEFVMNGRDAVDYLASHEGLDLILMDIMMPLMDGLEATKRIRDGEAGTKKKDIPIVALTAFALTSDREEILSQGLNYYISKPIDPDKLREVLTEIARKVQLSSL